MARAGSRTKKEAPRGWRWFLAEYAVVFAGVLTALGAEQLVSNLNQQAEIREARRALDAELAWNLTALQLRNEQAPCVDRRLDELDRWTDGWRTGGSGPLAGAVGRPVGLSFRTAVWGAAADVVAHMRFEEKVTYAQIYDDLANSQALRDREGDLWLSLGELQWSGVATPERQGRVKADIDALRRLNAATKGNFPIYSAPFQKLGVKPAPRPAGLESFAKAFCSPVVGP